MVCCCGHEEYKTLQLRLDLLGNMQQYVYSMYMQTYCTCGQLLVQR